MHYTISYNHPNQHFVDIVLTLEIIEEGALTIQLPAWRPGRYELGGFIENIQKFDVTDQDGQPVPFQKQTKDKWLIQTDRQKSIQISYNYFAFKMDAGSSYLDENQLYLNFINCLLFDPKRLSQNCKVTLNLPTDYEVACGLKAISPHELEADSFYHLVDAPMIASNQLTHYQYEYQAHHFHLWFMGNFPIDWGKMESDFLAFTKNQIEMMGEFPCENYHFLFQLLPHKFYHGVEHFNSTVITLGPGLQVNEGSLYEDLMGVSSHELFHTWNVIRIKPKEFLPYNFTTENYFTTGFVAEGFTTYYGDLFLARSKVFDQNWYLNEINKQLDRHLNNAGRFNLSLADSSFDLWVDGYKKGIPDRKVSIYTKGALVALIFDLTLRKLTQNKRSLDDVLRLMWAQFGDMQNGYDSTSILTLLNQVAGTSMHELFDNLINSCQPIESYLTAALDHVGCELKAYATPKRFEYAYGFKGVQQNNTLTVNQIFPHSEAAEKLSLNDEIIAINNNKLNIAAESIIGKHPSINLNLFRNGELRQVTLHETETKYFKSFKIEKSAKPDEELLHNFNLWLQC